jgi:hypothetical protein
MSQVENTLRIPRFSVVGQTTDLDREIAAFLIDRRARGLSSRTLDFYSEKINAFKGTI